SISRDLTDLGLVKLGGVYRLPKFEQATTQGLPLLQIELVGEYMIVLKTISGHASMACVMIDRECLPGVVGTIAGDDTIFIAVCDGRAQKQIHRQLLLFFRQDEE
ncbi:MAG: hypothetical protein AAGJ35_11885, partial [Myxococcota bacterium]